MSKDYLEQLEKITPFTSATSLLVTLNYYFGNPFGLPTKLQIVSASLFPLPSGGSLDLPIFFAGLFGITLIAYLYITYRK